MSTSKLTDAVRKQFLGIEPKPDVRAAPTVQVSDADLNKRLNRAIGVPLTQPSDPMLAVFERSSGEGGDLKKGAAGGDFKVGVVHSNELQREAISALAASQRRIKATTSTDAKLLAQCGNSFLYREAGSAGKLALVEETAWKADGVPSEIKAYPLTPQEVITWLKCNARNIVDFDLPPHLKMYLPKKTSDLGAQLRRKLAR
jgi:hypothetical protein